MEKRKRRNLKKKKKKGNSNGGKRFTRYKVQKNSNKDT